MLVALFLYQPSGNWSMGIWWQAIFRPNNEHSIHFALDSGLARTLPGNKPPKLQYRFCEEEDFFQVKYFIGGAWKSFYIQE